jgi:hypothetical protein
MIKKFIDSLNIEIDNNQEYNDVKKYIDNLKQKQKIIPNQVNLGQKKEDKVNE